MHARIFFHHLSWEGQYLCMCLCWGVFMGGGGGGCGVDACPLLHVCYMHVSLCMYVYVRVRTWRAALQGIAGMDPHTAWFTKHCGSDGGPAALLPPAPVAAVAAVGAAAGGGAGAAGLMPPPAPIGGRTALAAPRPVMWWQDEGATFGDVAPSAVLHAVSGSQHPSAGGGGSLHTGITHGSHKRHER